jgi:hypothetical protein
MAPVIVLLLGGAAIMGAGLYAGHKILTKQRVDGIAALDELLTKHELKSATFAKGVRKAAEEAFG